MTRDFDSCITAVEAMKPVHLFTQIRQLENVPDTRRTTPDVPELGTEVQKDEFCDVYDEFIRHYQALCNIGGEAEPTQRRNQAISW